VKWDDVKPFIAKYAPMLGAAVGGPFGALAGGIIGNILGTKDASPASIAAAIKDGTLTGEQIIALKQAEDDFAVRMKELDINSAEEMERIVAGDRDSARKREEDVRDWTPRILAYGVTIGFFAVLIFVLRWGIPSDAVSHDVILMLIGALGAAFTQNVMGYYFGGSSDANSHIQNLSKSLGEK